MRLYYCPKCGKEEISDQDLYTKEYTLLNIRDGFGRPIRHYKCECGNYLAGSMDVTGWDEDGIKYAMSIIKDYNLGGPYHEYELYLKAKQNYEKKHNTK